MGDNEFETIPTDSEFETVGGEFETIPVSQKPSLYKQATDMPSAFNIWAQPIADAIIRMEDEKLPGKIVTGIEAIPAVAMSPITAVLEELPPETQKIVGNLSNYIGLAANIIIDAQKQKVPSYGGEPFLQEHGADPQKNMLAESIVREWKAGNNSLGETIKEVAKRNGIKPDTIIGSLTRLGALATDLTTSFASLAPALGAIPKVKLPDIGKSQYNKLLGEAQQKAGVEKVQTPTIIDELTPKTSKGTIGKQPLEPDMIQEAPKTETIKPEPIKTEQVKIEPKQVIEETLNKPVETKVEKPGTSEFESLDPSIQDIVKKQATSISEQVKEFNKTPESLYPEVISQLKVRQPELFKATNAKDLAIEVNKINEKSGLKIKPEDVIDIFNELDKQSKANIDFGLSIDWQYPKFEKAAYYDPLVDRSLPRWVRERYAKEQGIPVKDIDKMLLTSDSLKNIDIKDISSRADSTKFRDINAAEILSSGETLLNKMGESGVKLANALKTHRREFDKLHSQYLNEVTKTGVTKLNKKELASLYDVMDGKTKLGINPKVTEAAHLLRDIYNKLHDEFKKTETTYGDTEAAKNLKYRKDYIQHEVDWEGIKADKSKFLAAVESLKSKEPGRIGQVGGEKIVNSLLEKQTDYYSETIKTIMKTDNINYLSAMDKLDGILEGIKTNSAKHMTEARRYDMPYKKTLEAINKYFYEATKVITDRKHLDLKSDGIYEANGRLNALIKNVGEGKNPQIARDIIDLYTGKSQLQFAMDNPKTARLLSNSLMWNSMTKMAFAALNNISQPSNVHAITGYKASAKAMLQQIKSIFKEDPELKNSGVLVKQIVEDYIQNRTLDKYYNITGMTASERMVRTFAYYAGREHAVSMFNDAKIDMAKGKTVKDSLALREMQKMDLLDAVLKQDKLTVDQIRDAGYDMSTRTMFKGDVLDVPPAAIKPLGRLIFALRRYSLAQGKFITQNIISEMKAGNYAPLLRLAASGYVTGEVVNDIRNLIKYGNLDARGKNVLLRAIENYGQSVGGIMAWDAVESMAYGKEGILGNMTGSVLSTIAEGGEALYKSGKKVVEGKDEPLRDISKFATKQVPIAGQIMAPRVFPPKRSK